MTSYIIFSIMLLGIVLIATASKTKLNTSAIAIFMAVIGWTLYIIFGYDLILYHHPREFMLYLMGEPSTVESVRYFIADNIFLKYVGKAAEIVLFLLATMTIVEILNTNGCFDFITNMLRTRSSKKMLWTICFITFLLSANIDSVTVTTMMLVIMHKIVANTKQRMFLGSAIMIAANCGGCMTVIGDPTGLALWNAEAITATNYIVSMAIPCLLASSVPIWLIGRRLPERLDLQWTPAPFRGDDTNLNRVQREVLGIVTVIGLWLIPCLHSNTKLSPFLGALSVLAVLWIITEIFNRKLDRSDQMIMLSKPRAAQYGGLQTILYIIGVVLLLGAARETGVLSIFADWLWTNVHNVFVLGTIAGVVSTFLDTFTTAIGCMMMYDVAPTGSLGDAAFFVENGAYWKLIAFCTSLGGTVFAVGSLSGLVLLKMEDISLKWFISHITWKVLLGWLCGMLFLFAEVYVFNWWLK